MTRFSMPWELSFFCTMPLSSTLSQLYIQSMAQLLLTPCIICLRCAYQNLQTFACFCTIDHTQSYKGRLFPQWLSQVVMTRAQPANHRWETQHSNHAANPTCSSDWQASKIKLSSQRWPCVLLTKSQEVPGSCLLYTSPSPRDS